MILKTLLSLIAPLGFLRLYAGGGGDGGAGDMRDAELKRQGQIQTAVDAINTKFGQPVNAFNEQAYIAANPDVAAGIARGEFSSGREHYDMWGRNEGRATGGGIDPASIANKQARDAQYTDISKAVRDTAMRDLDRQYGTASKRNTFGLARAGLLGGSADAESGGELQTLYGEGKLKATQAGQQAGADLRVADERTRQNLISLAQAGLDTGSANSMAAGQMAAAAEAAKAQAGGASVGRLFDDLSQAYVVNQVAKARTPQAQQPTTSYGYGGFNPSRYTGTVQR